MRDHGFDATIRAGSTGQFDVRSGDRLVFSKEHEHRFPEPAEVLALLRR